MRIAKFDIGAMSFSVRTAEPREDLDALGIARRLPDTRGIGKAELTWIEGSVPPVRHEQGRRCSVAQVLVPRPTAPFFAARAAG